MRNLVILVLAVILSGCGNNKIWFKPNSSQSEFSQDKYDCIQQAQQRVSGAYVDAYSGSSQNKVITNGHLFGSCMNSKGWYLRDKDELAASNANQPPKVAQAKKQLDELNQEVKASCTDPEFKPIYEKSGCMVDSITLDQLADTQKIAESEKKLFLKYYEAAKQRNIRAAAAFRSAGDRKGQAFGALVDQTREATEKNVLDLYEGKISWGEYNKRRKQINSNHKQEYEKIRTGTN